MPKAALAESTSQPSTTDSQLSVPLENESFDSAQYLTGDWAGYRKQLFDHGFSVEPTLILDYTHDASGGIDPGGNSVREHFDFPLQINLEKVIGLKGGTIYAVYQVEGGGSVSPTLTGDVQQISSGTQDSNRAQLGQLWYEQKTFDDQLRLRLGKLDGNSDFDVLENAVEFLNNAFSTAPTLTLLPSYPETATGAQIFFEPKDKFYAGAAAFDGSLARGVHTGEYGPKHFFQRLDDLFFILEVGQHYTMPIGQHTYPGKIGLGGWWDTNHFPHVDGMGSHSGTGGAYLICDQLLWKPNTQPTPSGPPGATVTGEPAQQEYPGAISSSFSFSWADPSTNFVDLNALGAFSVTGVVPFRPLDIAGLGATYAHISAQAATRYPYELTVETFYRIRISQSVSLKPDIQYIMHPSGSSKPPAPALRDALVLALRLNVAF